MVRSPSERRIHGKARKRKEDREGGGPGLSFPIFRTGGGREKKERKEREVRKRRRKRGKGEVLISFGWFSW